MVNTRPAGYNIVRRCDDGICLILYTKDMSRFNKSEDGCDATTEPIDRLQHEPCTSGTPNRITATRVFLLPCPLAIERLVYLLRSQIDDDENDRRIAKAQRTRSHPRIWVPIVCNAGRLAPRKGRPILSPLVARCDDVYSSVKSPCCTTTYVYSMCLYMGHLNVRKCIFWDVWFGV